MDIRPRHWAIALLGAIALHSSALVLFWEPSQAETAVAAGLGGVEVSLGPAGAPSGSMTAAKDVEAVDPVTTTTSEVEPVTPNDVPVPPEEIPVEAVETDEVPVEEVEAEEVETVEPAESEPVVDAPEPVQPAELVAPPTPDNEIVAMDPTPLPAPPPAKPAPPKPAVAEPAPTEAVAESETEGTTDPGELQQAEATGEMGHEGDTEFTQSGTQNATAGGGIPGPILNDYSALLGAWLEQNKGLPERAKRRKRFESVLVAFTIDRQGNLLSHEILESSGSNIFDEAAIATLERASPMPPMPDDIPGPEFRARVTLNFNVK